MSGAGYKLFQDQEILYGADVMSYLMSQAIMVFDNTTDRTNSISVPTEGMVCFLRDVDRLEVFNGTNWINFGDAIRIGTFNQKGDILVATTNDVATNVPVGTNGQVLTADSTTATGVRWVTPFVPEIPEIPDVFPFAFLLMGA